MRKKITLVLFIMSLSLSPIFAVYPKVAVVLSGGGAKGYAEIGVVEEIQKLGIPIDFICGTSMGALVGGFYAAGYSTEEIKRLIESNDMTSLLLTPTYTEDDELPEVFGNKLNSFYSFGISSKGIGDVPGIVGDQLILQFLSRNLIKNSSSMDFSKLEIPYKAITTDVTTSEKVVLSFGLLQDAMRASMSLPLIFPPFILLDGTYTMDGGLNDNFPISLAREWGADIIIAVNVSSDSLKNPGDYSTFSGVTIQLISLVTFKKNEGLLGKNDLVIRPEVADYTILDVGKYDEILKKGYEAAFENREKLLSIRDRISKTRDLVPYSSIGSYSLLPDPVVKEVKIVDVTRNSSSYSLSTIFDEFIDKTLNDKNLDELESDITRFNKVNNIATTSYSFTPYDSNVNSEGILYIYIRDWKKSKSRIAFSLDGLFGFSNNSENYSWANIMLDLSGIFANLGGTDLNAVVDLSFEDVVKGTGKLYYNISSSDNIQIDGIAGLSLSVGGISPVNTGYYKNRIITSGLQSSISVGTQLQYANDFLLQSNIVYNLSYLSPSSLPESILNSSNQIKYREPLVSQLKFLLGGVYSIHDPSIFSKDGFMINLNGMISNENNKFGYAGSFSLKYSYPFNKKDTLKFNFDLKFKNSNPELLDSYYSIGTYNGMVGYANSIYRRGYMLIDFTFQKEIGKLVGPLFLQTGIKLLSSDSYNPFENLYDLKNNVLMNYPTNSINIFDNFDAGMYVGVGTKIDKATFLIGLGYSISNQFALAIEFF